MSSVPPPPATLTRAATSSDFFQENGVGDQLETAIGTAVDAMLKEKPTRGHLHWLANHIAAQARAQDAEELKKVGGAAAASAAAAGETVEELKKTVRDLQGQIIELQKAKSELQERAAEGGQASGDERKRRNSASHLKISSHKVGLAEASTSGMSSVLTHEEHEARDHDLLEVRETTDVEMWHYLMEQFSHAPHEETHVSLESKTGRPNLRHSLLKVREQHDGKREELGIAALRMTSKFHLPPQPTDAQVAHVLKVAMQIDHCEYDADVIGLFGVLHYPMTFVVELVLQKYDAAAELRLEEAEIKGMLIELEKGYVAANSYHNAMHAADVAYTLHSLLEAGGRTKLKLTKLQLVACIVAAAAHDFRHPGTTNSYLIAAKDPLAIRYNDKAVLESMHASEFFKLIFENEKLNVFKNLKKPQQNELRKAIVSMILMTDMSAHFDSQARFQANFLCDMPEEIKEGEENQLFLSAVLLHAADISNPAKPVRPYLNWTDRVLAEFYAVGDLEKQNGIDVSMFCDRAQPKVQKCQIGFINFIVKPMFDLWGKFIPQIFDMCMPHILANLALWNDAGANLPPDQQYVDNAKEDWDPKKPGWRLKPGASEFTYPLGLLGEPMEVGEKKPASSLETMLTDDVEVKKARTSAHDSIEEEPAEEAVAQGSAAGASGASKAMDIE